MLPAGSTRTARPAARIISITKARPSTSAGEKATRLTPPCGFAPKRERSFSRCVEAGAVHAPGPPAGFRYLCAGVAGQGGGGRHRSRGDSYERAAVDDRHRGLPRGVYRARASSTAATAEGSGRKRRRAHGHLSGDPRAEVEHARAPGRFPRRREGPREELGGGQRAEASASPRSAGRGRGSRSRPGAGPRGDAKRPDPCQGVPKAQSRPPALAHDHAVVAEHVGGRADGGATAAPSSSCPRRTGRRRGARGLSRPRRTAWTSIPPWRARWCWNSSSSSG